MSRDGQVHSHLGVRGAGEQDLPRLRVPEVPVPSSRHRGACRCVGHSGVRTAGATAGGFREGGTDAHRQGGTPHLLFVVFSRSRRAGAPRQHRRQGVPRQVRRNRLEEGQDHQGGLQVLRGDRVMNEDNGGGGDTALWALAVLIICFFFA